MNDSIHFRGKLVYFSNLNSLRAIAALLVVLFHCEEWLPSFSNLYLLSIMDILSFNGRGGEIGVHFFFILSGFLITFLLLNEIKHAGAVHIGKFYLRRFFRIWPLYFFTLLIGFAIIPLFIPNEQSESSLFMYVLFLSNIDNISSPTNNGILGVHWSVAIEEQFYLFWPLLFFLNKRLLLFFMFILFAFSEIFFLLVYSLSVKYLHTFSNIRLLATGGMLGYISFYRGAIVEKILSHISRKGFIILHVFFVCLLFFSIK